MNRQDDISLTCSIRATGRNRAPVEGKLETDERVLARIAEAVYRQPSSALRKLVSSAHNADATDLVILTDARRFGQITVRDNGRGLGPEVVVQLVTHTGGSTKRSERGEELGVTSPTNGNRSEGGRMLLGKLGIGLFSVAQLTWRFLIITKTTGDGCRTVADITLGRGAEHEGVPSYADAMQEGQTMCMLRYSNANS